MRNIFIGMDRIIPPMIFLRSFIMFIINIFFSSLTNTIKTLTSNTQIYKKENTFIARN